MMFASKAIRRGASAWTGTFYGNLWLGLIWLSIGICRWDVISVRRMVEGSDPGIAFLLGPVPYFSGFSIR